MGYTEDLDRRMWRTKGARFNAYRRLSKKDVLSSYAIVLLSAYTTCLSILDLTSYKNLLTSGVATTIVSTLTLAVSLLVTGRNCKGTAEQLHQCAKAISVLYDQLQAHQAASGAPGPTNAFLIGQEYEKLVQGYSVNHDPIDDARFRIDHPGSFNVGLLKTLGVRVA